MKHHRWTEEELLIVRRDYQGTMRSAAAIAQYLSAMTGENITMYAVTGQVQKLGISFIRRKSWTTDEDERLSDLIGKYDPKKIARIMGRSVNSVVVRSKRLGCSRRARNGWFTKREVCEILGVDHRLAQAWIDAGKLKASWHHDAKPQQKGGACWHVEEKDLRDFLRRYPTELVGRNVDLVTIVHILAGIKDERQENGKKERP